MTFQSTSPRTRTPGSETKPQLAITAKLSNQIADTNAPSGCILRCAGLNVHVALLGSPKRLLIACEKQRFHGRAFVSRSHAGARSVRLDRTPSAQIETLHTHPLLDGLSELLGFRSRVRRLMAARLPGAKCGAVFAPGRQLAHDRGAVAARGRANRRSRPVLHRALRALRTAPAGAGAPASRANLHATPRGIRERVMEDIQRPLVLAHLDLEARRCARPPPPRVRGGALVPEERDVDPVAGPAIELMKELRHGRIVSPTPRCSSDSRGRRPERKAGPFRSGLRGRNTRVHDLVRAVARRI